jgi:hypothetical protein
MKSQSALLMVIKKIEYGPETYKKPVPCWNNAMVLETFLLFHISYPADGIPETQPE